MGYRGKAFGDCAKVVMGWFKGVVIIWHNSVEHLEEKPKEGREGIEVDQGGTSVGKQREKWLKVDDYM